MREKKLFIAFSIVLALTFTIKIQAQSLITLGGSGQDYTKDLVVDNQGNIVAVGYFWSPGIDFDPGTGTVFKTSVGLNDIFIAKYSAAGQLIWVNTVGSTGIDMPHTVMLDNNDNIILSGYFSNTCDFDPGPSTANSTSNGGRDGFIARYDPNGYFNWVVTYGADSLDDAYNVDADNQGNVYWSGLFEGTVTVGGSTFISQNEDVIFGKISGDGNIIWVKQMGGTGTDAGSGIMVDNAGDIIQTGYFQNTVDFDPNTGVANLTSSGSTDSYFGKYDNAGNLLWIKKIGGPAADIAAPGGITIDHQNNIYVSGNAGANCDYDPGSGVVTHPMNGATDWFVAKYDLSGSHILSYTVGGPGQDQAHRLVTDDLLNIYVTGWFRETADFNPNGNPLLLTGNCSGGGHDGYIAKYNDDGICLWAKQFGGIVNGADQLTLGTSVKLLSQQQIVFGGRFHGGNAFGNIPLAPIVNSNGASDLFICSLDSAGNFQSSPTGVVEVSHPNVEIFPNPASDYLQVNAHGYSGEAEIINSLGLIIWKSPMKDYQRIDISSLHGGFYFLKIKNSVYKFMVLK